MQPFWQILLQVQEGPTRAPVPLIQRQWLPQRYDDPAEAMAAAIHLLRSAAHIQSISVQRVGYDPEPARRIMRGIAARRAAQQQRKGGQA